LTTTANYITKTPKDFSVTLSAFYGLEEIAGVVADVLDEGSAERPGN